MTYDNAKYSALQIARKLKIPRSNLQQYVDKGFIKASGKRADGKGTRNEFTKQDIIHLRLFLDIHELGIPQAKASKLSHAIIKEYEKYQDPMEKIDYDWLTIVKDGNDYRTEGFYGPDFQRRMDSSKARTLRVINPSRVAIYINSLFE